MFPRQISAVWTRKAAASTSSSIPSFAVKGFHGARIMHSYPHLLICPPRVAGFLSQLCSSLMSQNKFLYPPTSAFATMLPKRQEAERHNPLEQQHSHVQTHIKDPSTKQSNQHHSQLSKQTHTHPHTHTHPPPSPSPSALSSSASTMPSGVVKKKPPPLGWYQRPLPAALIPFSSNRGRQLFKEALSMGCLEGYFLLAEQFTTQSEPAFCGPGTLAMVLNALALDPQRIWKGNWRWFSEEMLETCDIRKPRSDPLKDVDTQGITFEEFLLLAECNGARVDAFRAEHSSEAKLRAAILSSSSRTDLITVVSFSRKLLGQTGSGHYSPIGGFHPLADMALVLDVARFKYPPYWCPISLLWKAVKEVDPDTGSGRGYYLMSRGGSSASSSGRFATSVTALSQTCRIAVDQSAWRVLAQYFCQELPKHFQKIQPKTAAEVFRGILTTLPVQFTSIFTMYTHDLSRRMSDTEKSLKQSKKSIHDETNVHLHPHHQHHHEHQHEHDHTCNPINVTAIPHNSISATPAATVSAAALSSSHSTAPMFPNYASYIPACSPHHHPHRVSSLFSLAPLLDLIADTAVFKALDADAAAVELPYSHLQLHTAIVNDAVKAIDGAENSNSNIISGVSTESSDVADRKHLDQRFNLSGGLAKFDRDIELQLSSLLIYAVPLQSFSNVSSSLQTEIAELRDVGSLPVVLQKEIDLLKAQMGILGENCLCKNEKRMEGKRPMHRFFTSTSAARKALANVQPPASQNSTN